MIKIKYSLYELQELTGIDSEVLAGMIEEKRLQADIIAGEYIVTRENFQRWANSVIDLM